VMEYMAVETTSMSGCLDVWIFGCLNVLDV